MSSSKTFWSRVEKGKQASIARNPEISAAKKEHGRKRRDGFTVRRCLLEKRNFVLFLSTVATNHGDCYLSSAKTCWQPGKTRKTQKKKADTLFFCRHFYLILVIINATDSLRQLPKHPIWPLFWPRAETDVLGGDSKWNPLRGNSKEKRSVRRNRWDFRTFDFTELDFPPGYSINILTIWMRLHEKRSELLWRGIQ